MSRRDPAVQEESYHWIDNRLHGICEGCLRDRKLQVRDLDAGDAETGPQPWLVAMCAQCWWKNDRHDERVAAQEPEYCNNI